MTLTESLTGQFVIVNLGAAADRDLDLPASIRSAITLIEVDANESSQTNGTYYAHHRLKTAIAGSSGRQTFRQNAYGQSSSILDPNEDLIKIYRLDDYYKPIAFTTVECETLPEVLKARQVDSVDFLKTDLEGM